MDAAQLELLRAGGSVAPPDDATRAAREIQLAQGNPLPVVTKTPQEEAQIQSEVNAPTNLAAIDAEIARTPHPLGRAVLQEERARVAAAQAPPKPPPTWDEVTKLPEIQALPFEHREAARNQYFLDVVAPEVPTEQLDAARAAFDADTKPGLLNEAIERISNLLPKKPAAPNVGELDSTPDLPVSEAEAQAKRAALEQPARMTMTRAGEPVLQGGRIVPPAESGPGDETAPILESVKAVPKLFQLGAVQAIPQMARQYQDLDQTVQEATAARDALQKRVDAKEPYTPPDYNQRLLAHSGDTPFSPEEELHQKRVLYTPPDSLGSYETEINGLDHVIKIATEHRDHYAKISELVGKDIQAATPKDQGIGGKVVTTAAQSAPWMILGVATRSPKLGAVPGTMVQGAQAFEQTMNAGEDARKRLPEFQAAQDKLKYIQDIAANEEADDTTRKAATNALEAMKASAEVRRAGTLSSAAEAQENAKAIEQFGHDLKFIGDHATVRNAKLNAGIQAVAEYAGEEIGLGAIMKPGSKLAPKLAESLATNFGQEFVTQGMQSLSQYAIYDPTMTVRDALEQMFIAGGAGAVTAGPLTVGSHVLEKAIDFANRPRQEKPAAAPAAEVPPGKPGELPTVGELLSGERVPTRETPPSEAAKPEAAGRIVEINGQLGMVATSLSKAREDGNQQQIDHYQARAKELIDERAGLEKQVNPDVAADDLQRQNRDRTRAASVAQVQSIANKPDYDRLGTAPIPDVGAPMVSVKGDTEAIPPADMGKASVVTLGDGTKIPMRYAVVEADSVLASNDVNGKRNQEYFGKDIPAGRIVAMTNGRVAGLQGAYARDTAAPYKAGMLADPEHGVSAEAINAKANPMLVRVYPDSYNALPRLAQLSNTGGSAQLSDTEKARGDAAALDSLDGFVPTESGDVTGVANMPFVRRFMQSIPENERPEMMTATGELSQAGVKRLRAAVFAKAYGGGEVLARMIESSDDNVRSITAGLMRAAPAVARLREKVAAGALHDLDITPALLAAIEDISRLRESGTSVGAWIAQADMFGALPREVGDLMQFLEDNARSGRRIADFLERYLAAAEAIGSPQQAGMFEQKVPSKADVVRGVTKEMANERQTGLPQGARTAATDTGTAARGAAETGAEPVPGPLEPIQPGEKREGGARAEVGPVTKQEFASTQAPLPAELSASLKQIAKRLIAPDDVEKEHGLEDRPHITVKFGLHTPDVAAVRKVVSGEGPIQAKVTGIEIFSPEGKDYDVVVQRVSSPDLTRLNKAIADAIPNTDTHPVYRPHITLGYVKKGTGKKYADAKTGLEGQTITLDTIEVSDQNENLTPIKLTGESKVERRADAGRRKAIAEMSPEEMRRELLTDPLTGLANRRAYDESEKQPAQVSIDLDSLKWINDNLGHSGGDEILRALGTAIREQTESGYHLSGDEFVIQSNSEQEARRVVQALRNRLIQATLVFKLPDGSEVTKKGVNFSHGIGQTLEEADAALRSSKAEREVSGERARRGEPPAGVTRRPTPGHEAPAGEAAAKVAQKGAAYAVETGKQSEGGQREHPGISPGADLRADQGQVREETGGQASRGGGAVERAQANADRVVQSRADGGERDQVAGIAPLVVKDNGKAQYRVDEPLPPKEGTPADRKKAAAIRDLFSEEALPGAPSPGEFDTLVAPVQRGEIRVNSEKVDSPESAAHAFAALRKEPREKFQVLVLDKNDKPIAALHLFVGTIAQTSVYPREVLTAVYQTPGAAKIWMAHNHPSGIPEPSAADERLTRDLTAGLGKSVGVEFAGHIIIAAKRAVAFNNDGPMKPAFDIPAGTRNVTVPIMERTIRKQKFTPRDALSSPNAVRSFLRTSGKTEPGLVLLNAHHNVSGWLPMSLEEAGKLRTGDANTGAGRLFRTVGVANPAAAIFYSPQAQDIDRFARAVNNLSGALNLLDVRMLDAMAPQSGTNSNALVSLAERGTIGTGVGNTFLSRSGGQRQGLSGMAQADVNAVADIYRKGFKGMPPVHVLESVKQAPAALRADIKRLGGENDTAGAWHNGEVYLFSDNITNPMHAEWVILHENTHHGLRGMLGSNLKPLLMDIYIRNPEIRRLANEQRARNPNLSMIGATEEVLANMGADGVPQGIMARIVAAVRKFLRQIGFKMQLSDSDIQGLVAQALRFVKEKPEQTHVLSGTALHPGEVDNKQGKVVNPPIKSTESRLSRTAGQPSRGQGALGLAPASRGLIGHYVSVANKVIDFTDRLSNPLVDLPGQADYLGHRQITMGIIDRGNDIVKMIKAVFKDSTPEARQAASDYFLTAGAKATKIPDAMRTGVENIKKLINDMSDKLVSSGVISAEAREEFRDRYLPQLYLRWLLEDKHWKTIGGKKASDLGYTKERKLIQFRNDQGELKLKEKGTGRVLSDAEVLSLGPVTDPAFLASVAIARSLRDMAILDWLGKISTDSRWVLPNSIITWNGKRVSPYFVKEEATRLRKQAEHYQPEDARRTREYADRMDAAADQAIAGLPESRDGYLQIPKAARYGALRGVWVREEIYHDLMGSSFDMSTDPNWFEDWFGTGGKGETVTRWWKATKTILNLPGQLRNIATNFSQLQLDGIGFHKMPGVLAKAVSQMRSNGPYYKEFKQQGGRGGTFSNQELGRMERDLLELQAKAGALSTMQTIHRMAAIVYNAAGDAWQAVEVLGKMMAFVDSRDAGADASKAMARANKVLFDYSLVPSWVRYARRIPFGIAFATWNSKVLPRLVETALKHPHRFLPYAIFYYGAQFALASMLGVGYDDLERLKKAMPEWLANKRHAVLMPWKDEYGRWEVVDLGYIMPWTNWLQLATDTATGKVTNVMNDIGAFSGPIPNIISAISTGQDPFTHRDIANKGDPPARQAVSWLNYAWSMAVPPFLSDTGALGHGIRAYTGQTNKYGDPLDTPTQAALRAFGINRYPLEPDQARAANIRKQEFEIQEVKQAAKLRLLDRSMSPEKRDALIEEYRTEAQRRQEKLVKYISESGIHPALQTGR